MTRRKSACTKWTLVLVVLYLSYVNSRPQDSSPSPLITTLRATDTDLRYKQSNLRFSNKLPKIVSFGTNSDDSNSIIKANQDVSSKLNVTQLLNNLPNSEIKLINISKAVGNLVNNKVNTIALVEILGREIVNGHQNRTGKLISTKTKIKNSKKTRPKNNIPKVVNNDFESKPIRKVITKWTDQTKDLIPETTTSHKDRDKITFTTFDDKEAKNHKKYYKPKPQNPDEHKVYSNHVHILEYPFPNQNYFHTTQPTPTPIITNVGYPKPWYHNRKTTQKPKPVQDYTYNQHNYEVTTFPPSNGYTEKIIIRPDEYSGSSDDCPTIYLTLNNTFQGQAKEACPDLNIAVNTNVINKNVVVESEEGSPESIFSNPFGIPLGDDLSSDGDSGNNDYFDSDETPEQESASVEGESLSYNAANALQGESSEVGGYGAPTQIASAAITKPHRPSNHKDDDLFSFTSMLDFFKPAMNVLNWFTAINPLSLGIFPLILTPLAFLFAGSGLAALFSPWFLPLGREAPKIVHVYKPNWYWDDKAKSWHSHTFPPNRRWQSEARDSKELIDSIKPTILSNLKELINLLSKKVKEKEISKEPTSVIRKNKRRKRENWAIRVKYKSSTTLEDTAPSVITAASTSARDVKTKVPIRESIKMVANQLLDKPTNESAEPIVAGPKVVKQKPQSTNKHKIKIKDEDKESSENARPGIAEPITLEDIESENKIIDVTNESSTTNEGISTWVLLSNPSGKDNLTSTEATKVDDKKKPINTKGNKPKRPNNNKTSGKRPIIASNKADLVAAGSAINENVYNKIKDTVLTNVQKNKSTTQKTTVLSSTEAAVKESETTKRDTTKASLPDTQTPEVKIPSKPKKKNKNKHRTSTTESTIISESALLPMEPKEQEIELEISTPPTTTKKPKRSTTRKKTKTKKRKTSKPSADTETKVIEKTSNKTKSAKPGKKPAETAVVSQIYNYLSREVMPSVGVGMIGLASLVGIASYFFYPFSTPVRRTFEVDKKDDLYKYNGEEYANDGNGQAEEEMLGTVLAGMPAHAKNKLNPYSAQTPQYSNRYGVKKEQDLRYRQVTKYDPMYSRYPQQKTGIAHAAVYPKPAVYGPQYETRHTYTTEAVYNYEKASSQYTPYPAVEPIYAAPQTGPSASFSSDTSNSVVYGVKPSPESNFKPVYPYEGQFYSESTSNPEMYQPTSMYLGSNDDETKEDKNDENESDETDESKFVVGNVPKELVESATPAVVPEHGPRKLRKKRSIKRSISSSLEELLREKDKDNFISNEIDDAVEYPIRNLAPQVDPLQINDPKEDVISIYAVPADSDKTVIESISTAPVEDKNEKTESVTNIETTTKEFKVYEVFTSKPEATEQSDKPTEQSQKPTDTTFRSIMTETTTELKSETTSTMPPSPSPFSETKLPPTSDKPQTTTSSPEVITYPPLNQSGGFFSFLRRLVEFKYRLGLSILQTTSESLTKYLRSMESSLGSSMQKVVNASKV